jgi:hypothetical protein
MSLENWQGSQPINEVDKDTIIEIQTILKAICLYGGDVDGIVGKKTIVAFKDFKQKEYLEYPTILGTTTAKVLLDVNKNHKAPKDIDHGVLSPTPFRKIPLLGTVSVKTPIANTIFTWDDATKGLTRPPETQEVVDNILSLARYLRDVVVPLFPGRKFKFTSWYRPRAVNNRVSENKSSRHIQGDACDFNIEGVHPKEIFDKLDALHTQGGLAYCNEFIHLDIRGYKARWEYN